MTEIKLRDYQRGAIDAVFAAWKEGMRRPAIVLPTGAGKTVVFASLIKEFMPWADDDTAPGIPANRGKRVIVLAHRDELVDQAIAKIRAIAPELKVGKVKAQSNEIEADVMVCSVQTLASKVRLAWVSGRSQMDYGPIGLIITDECHHAAAASYKRIYAAFPDALQLGVTATMARGDGVGLGKVWDDVVYKRSILNLISKGHLVDVRTKQIDLKGLDLGAVKTSMKDWQAGDLGQALMEAEADTAIARAYREHAGDRQGLVFTPTVETAHAAMDALASSGIPAAVVDGTTPLEERRVIYESCRRGKVQVLVNCMVLTEGFDMPQLEVAVIARPTQSAPLYTQMVGRVLRPWPGKKEALVLDLVGASANKLRTLIDLEPGVIKALKDDESLAEAAVREAEEGDQKIPAGSIAFELKARDVDSFGASATAWIRTPGGVMFIGCGTVRVFLWPTPEQPGLWDVCVAETRKPWARTRHQGLSLGEAMAWAEAVAEDHQAFGVAKSAAWRKKKPSESAKQLATALGIEVTEGLRAGELSSLIDTRMGAQIFDRFVKG
jgi:superfamily II DNA or RNA helicase